MRNAKLWFVVKLVFRIKNSSSESPHQFDEQWRLIASDSEAQAMALARDIGRRKSEVIHRPDNSKVSWEFIAISDMIELSSKSQGMELFSRIEQPDNHTHYLHVIQTNSRQLEMDGLSH